MYQVQFESVYVSCTCMLYMLNHTLMCLFLQKCVTVHKETAHIVLDADLRYEASSPLSEI